MNNFKFGFQHESGMDVAIMLSKLFATAAFPVTEKRISDSIWYEIKLLTTSMCRSLKLMT